MPAKVLRSNQLGEMITGNRLEFRPKQNYQVTVACNPVASLEALRIVQASREQQVTGR